MEKGEAHLHNQGRKAGGRLKSENTTGEGQGVIIFGGHFWEAKPQESVQLGTARGLEM